MSIEKALGKLRAAQMCHPNAVQALIDEAITAIQQPATGEPVYWEWRHLRTHPDTVDFGQWSKWQRVEARSAIHAIDDALAEFRTYIAKGYKYELRALYNHPAPSDDVVRDAERYRLIRDGSGWPAVFAAHDAPEPLRGDDLDAAMLATKDTK